MRVITAAAVSLLISLGLLVAPASAEEQAEPTCEETVQVWKDRAVAAEAEADRLDVELFFAQSRERQAKDQATALTARLGFTERLLADAEADTAQMTERFYRQRNKVERQRAIIRRLRTALARR